MDIFLMIVKLLGGLALFLYGMHLLSEGLEKLAGGKIEKILKKLTSNPFKGLLLGIGITTAVQSSSAVTVMLVGLVNSGIMKLSQAISIIMGSNIGTTFTAWILSLMGVEDGQSSFLTLLKPSSFSPIVAFIGILLIMVAKKQKKKDIGVICIGFAVLMYGMEFMSGSVEPLADMPGFSKVLTAFSNPLLGVLAGTVITGIIQSSAASVGMLQALSLTGQVSYAAAIPIIMGQNIGTCVTSLLSSFGTNRNAKRVAAVHILFNSIGTIIFLLAWIIINAIVEIPFANDSISPFNIALIHSIFNFSTTIILFPFAKLLEKLAHLVVKEKETDESKEKVFLDERLLTVPSIAVGNSLETAKSMAKEAENAVFSAITLFEKFDAAKADAIVEAETILDNYEDKLGSYLVKLSNCQLSDNDAKNVSMLLHVITDFERIGDHAENLVDVSREMYDKEISFSHEARYELNTLTNAVTEILKDTVHAFTNGDLALATSIEPLEQVIDTLVTEIRTRHISRLQKGSCTIELGFVLTDLLTNCERISDHCSNIAVAMIEAAHGTFDTHEYLHAVKTQQSGSFVEQCENWKRKFEIKYDI